MFRLRRMALVKSSAFVITPKRFSRKTLAPMFATRFWMYMFVPLIKATTVINAATDKMIPSSVRNDRILCARKVLSATEMGSRKDVWGRRAMLREGYVEF